MSTFPLLKKLNQFSHYEWKSMSLGLSRMEWALSKLGYAQNLPIIHVAGTNGKGSTTAILQALLSAAGDKVGVFTSPHLVKVNERFRIAYEEISDEMLEEVLSELYFIFPDLFNFEKPILSFFEICVLIALRYFQNQKVTLAIFETGLGGRLDATNVFKPILSLITEIGIDHQAFLGDSIEKIAFEKAGIIKASVPIVCGASDKKAKEVIKQVASQKEAPFVKAIDAKNVRCDGFEFVFDWEDFTDLSLNLKGAYQVNNAALALNALFATPLFDLYYRRLPLHKIRLAFKKVYHPGRLEIISEKPTIILDGSHNLQGLKASLESICCLYPKKHIKVLLGLSQDKDAPEILKFLSQETKQIYFVAFSHPRALSIEECEKISHLNLSPNQICFGSSLKEGLDLAKQSLKEDEILWITGSLFLVGEVKKCL